MSARHLPVQPLAVATLAPVVDRATWQAKLDDLLVEEKAHTRRGDELAAARRRLPMVEVPSDATVMGPDGEVSIHDTFEGRRMLVAYFHMWHAGRPWPEQCEGCTFCASQIQRIEYLHARDITPAIFCQGTYQESRPYADFLRYVTPWYSAQGATTLLNGRGFGFHACYVRDDEGRVYETYWTSGRGVETQLGSYGVMDLTIFGRQERFENSPEGWPRLDEGQHQWRIEGRPTAQWAITDAAAHGDLT